MDPIDYEPLLRETEENEESEQKERSPSPDTPPPQERFKLRTINVEPVLVLYFLAFVPSRMLIEQFLYTLISEEHNVTSIVRLDQNETHCTVNKSDRHFMEHAVIQDDASQWAMYLKFTLNIPAVFAVLASGTVSDRYSRKLPIILPVIGNTLQMGMCVVMVLFKLQKPYLFLAYALDGFTGTYVTLLMGCFAYTGNATSQKSRTLRIAINELCIGIAISISDVGIGYMIKKLGFLYPFIFVIGIQFINLLYIIFGLQETQTKSYSHSKISCGHLLEPFTIFVRKRPDNKRWKLGVIDAIFWFYAFAAIGRYSVATLYLQNVPFCWNAKLLGYYAAVSAIVYGLGNIVPAVAVKDKDWDVPLLVASGISAFASMILLAFSVTPFMLYLVILVAVFHQLGYTMLRALMSKQVKPNEQGAVFANVAFIEVACDLLGGVTFNSIYSATLLVFRGFVFLIVAGIFGVGTLISLVLYWKTRCEVTHSYALVKDSNSFDNEEVASTVGVNAYSVGDFKMGSTPGVATDIFDHISLTPSDEINIYDQRNGDAINNN